MPRALAVAALAVLVLLQAGPAAAHARLTATDPAGGSTLDEAPGRVRLTFSEPIESDFAQLQVTNAAGQRVDAGSPSVDGDTVTVPLDDLSEAGTYNVAFRVVSADGHPVEATFAFDVTPAAVAEQTPAPVPGDTPTAPATALPTPATEAPAAVASPTPAAIPDQERSSAFPGLVAAAAIVAGLAGGAFLAVRRATR